MTRNLPEDMELAWGHAAAQASHWHAVESTFSPTQEHAQAKLEAVCELLKATKAGDDVAKQVDEWRDSHSIYKAVKIHNADKFGLASNVITESNWRGVCQRKGWQ